MTILCAVIAFPAVADAQLTAGQFTVTPKGGWMTFDKASGIDDAPHLGVEASYNFSSIFSLGLGLLVSRPQTRGQDFITQLTFVDTTFLFQVTQPLTMVDIGLNAMVRLPGDRFSPYLRGGAGRYTLYMDPQVVSGSERFSQLSLMGGGGINIRVAERVGIQLDVRDLVFTKYDRDRLNPIRSVFTNTRFIEDVPLPPTSKETVHNIVFSLGFSFSPSSRTTSTGGEEGDQ